MAAQMKTFADHCDDCPKAGDTYECGTCGMALQITSDCKCADAACVSLCCCGAPMAKTN